MLRKLAILVAAAALAVGVGACNTVQGMGKDMKAAGSAIEKAADKSKSY